jgi:hypothetical protein
VLEHELTGAPRPNVCSPVFPTTPRQLVLTKPCLRSWWRGAPVVAEFFFEDLDAEGDAFVADRAGWSGDDLADVAAALAAERAAGEFAAQFALSVVGPELFGDFPRGFGDLLECAGSSVKIGVRIVECGGELVECSVQELPGDDREPWAVTAERPGGAASRR